MVWDQFFLIEVDFQFWFLIINSCFFFVVFYLFFVIVFFFDEIGENGFLCFLFWYGYLFGVVVFECLMVYELFSFFVVLRS